MDEPADTDPLVDRVNALLQRHQQALRGPDDDVPVLTEVVEGNKEHAPEEIGRALGALDPASSEGLVAAINRAVLEQLEPALERLFAERAGPALAAAMATVNEALNVAGRDLQAEVQRIVYDAVAKAVAQALDMAPRDKR